MISRCFLGGPIYMPTWMQYPANRYKQNIQGNGLDGGGQGASGMSALGGTIRLGEFKSELPIRHALKINPWPEKYCYYSETIRGFVWPAIRLDNYAKYFTEDAAWDTWDIIVERDVEIEFHNTFGFSMNSNQWKSELNKLMKSLSIIRNNTIETIGGGGEPMQSLAPNFVN